MGVSENSGTSKSSILIGFSIINHPFWGPTPIFGNTQIAKFGATCPFVFDDHIVGIFSRKKEWNAGPRWWQLKLFLIFFTPKFGEDILPILTKIFQLGWYNQQLEVVLYLLFHESWEFRCSILGKSLEWSFLYTRTANSRFKFGVGFLM